MITINPEEFKAAWEQRKQILEKLGSAAKIVVYTYLICWAVSSVGLILFLVLKIAGNSFGRPVFYITLAFGVIGWAVRFLGQKYENAMSMKYDGFKADKFCTKALTAFKKAPFSYETDRIVSENIALSSDKSSKAYLRHLLTGTLLIKGDTDGAYRLIVNDPQLFAENRYFEMMFYYDLVLYYTELAEMGKGSDAVRYAEDSYNNMERVFLECQDRAKNDYMTMTYFADAQQLICFMRGEWQNCREIIGMRFDNLPDKADPLLIAPNKLMLAECLYNLGEYKEALRYCDEAGPVLAQISYQLDKANRLAGKIHQKLDAAQ